MTSNDLRYPLTEKTLHLCVDMQRIFSAAGLWPTPWIDRVLPKITELASRFPERTVFTRFITPMRASDMPGMWRRYYTRRANATREQVDPEMLELIPELRRLSPPAVIINKTRYSGFAEPDLAAHLHDRRADGLIVSGSETDVCVLATVLGAVDLGYRVVVVKDALCSSSDEGHDASMRVYEQRYSEQIETTNVETILSAWLR